MARQPSPQFGIARKLIPLPSLLFGGYEIGGGGDKDSLSIYLFLALTVTVVCVPWRGRVLQIQVCESRARTAAPTFPSHPYSVLVCTCKSLIRVLFAKQRFSIHVSQQMTCNSMVHRQRGLRVRPRLLPFSRLFFPGARLRERMRHKIGCLSSVLAEKARLLLQTADCVLVLLLACLQGGEGASNKRRF